MSRRSFDIPAQAPALTSILASFLLGGVAWGGLARADDARPAELRRLFPQEADLVAQKGGLSRLVLPPEIVAACRPDLSDLRLFDAQEKEVPFLVDAGLPAAQTTEVLQRFEPAPIEAARRETRRETGPPLRRESFDLAMPDAAPQTGTWVLIVETGASEFVARARVEEVGSDGTTTSLIEDGSIFRLRGPRAAEKVRLSLPPFRGRRVRIILETEHPFWLEPSFRLESARALERGGRIAVPLQLLATRRDGLQTVVDLLRPRGIVPDLLRIETTTETFDRRVEAWDEGPGSLDGALGSGRIFRVLALVPVGEQEVPLVAARGDRLRVAIDDGDSPPLTGLAFAAVIRQPSLIFTLPSGPAGEVAGVLRFGGGRAHPPHYDLAGLLPPPQGTATGKRAEAAALLYDRAAVRPAHLGASRPNPAYDGAPALAFAMHPGAELDRRVFSHLRSITLTAAAEGLSRLRLEPEDLAVMSDDLSDLRVADDRSRQRPYLIEREAATDLVPLEYEGPERRDATSRYLLKPPVSPLRFDRLLLDTDAGFFDRGFRLEARAGEGEMRVLARGRLTRPIGDPRTVSIEVTPVRVDSLQLVVEDGDDAPLVFRSVRARVLLPEVYLTAPAGRYALLMGAPGQAAPRYELERVRDVVLAVKAAPVEASGLQANRDYSLQARLKGHGLRQTVLMWAALIAAVVVLAALTLRLARREPSATGGEG